MRRKLVLIFLVIMICAVIAGCDTSVKTEREPEQFAPVFGDQIKEGIYSIDVSSSSSMFRIVDTQLTAKDGKMSAVLTLSGTGYLKLYMGTGEEALADTDDKCIYFVENDEGQYTYEVPVEALNADISCAAWSIRKEKWYDRTLVFQSALIPQEALIEQPEDGSYEIDVTLSGGSGRASVESPVGLTINDGKKTAVIVWSSPYYDYMLMDGTYYYPVNPEGNSVFEIPVLYMDKDIAISAETIAMSEPHVIDYTLRFDSSTMKKAGSGNIIVFTAAAVVLVAAAVLIILIVKKIKDRGQRNEL